MEVRWKNLCRLLFKEEIGGLLEYAPWLTEDIEPIGYRKSSTSGKEVVFAPTAYSANSKWISFDEVDFGKKFEPLDINEIKDMDSLVGALGERFCYTGNIFFGKSSNIERSSNINDSFYIYNCARFGNSKHLAYSTIGRVCEDCFGCNAIDESAYCIKCSHSHRNKRCFELWMSQNSSDSYYSYGINGCSNCMFSFNVKNKRYAIGNLELGAAKYNSIRNKLVSEIAEELKKNKRVDSLIDIVKKSANEIPDIKFCSAQESAAPVCDKSKIENAFAQTTSILFGKKLEGGIDAYAPWLTRHTRKVEECRSAASGKKIFIPTYANYPKLPKDRLLAMAEAQVLGETEHLKAEDMDSLSMHNVHEKLGKLAFFNVEMLEGTNQNLWDCAISVDSMNCYKSSVTEYSKYCAYSFWPRSCQYLFGCDSPFDSSFSINCYSCTQLTRCFEIDCCGYCSDVYFAHNCENVHQSMFCFNLKNRRNHIGNAPYPVEEYGRIKKSLLEQIAGELEAKRDLKWDIYNIGCGQ